jgi:hypothetical protein
VQQALQKGFRFAQELKAMGLIRRASLVCQQQWMIL